MSTTVVMTPADMIDRFVRLRDKIAEVRDVQKKQLAPFNAAMEQLEGMLLIALDQAGLDSMRADAGTVFTSTRTSATVKDWPVTLEFIKTNDAWDLLEARVSKTAVLAVIEDTGAPVPGVSVTQERTLNVRRS